MEHDELGGERHHVRSSIKRSPLSDSPTSLPICSNPIGTSFRKPGKPSVYESYCSHEGALEQPPYKHFTVILAHHSVTLSLTYPARVDWDGRIIFTRKEKNKYRNSESSSFTEGLER